MNLDILREEEEDMGKMEEIEIMVLRQRVNGKMLQPILMSGKNKVTIYFILLLIIKLQLPFIEF